MPKETEVEKTPRPPQEKTDVIGDTVRKGFVEMSALSVWTIVRVVLLAFIVWNLGGFLTGIVSSLSNLLFMVVLSIFFGYLINPLVRFIRRPFKERSLDKIMPRSLAIVIAYVIVFSILGVGIANLAPRIAGQASEFADNLPNYALVLQDRVTELNNRYDQLKISAEFQQKLNERINLMLDSFANFITSTVLGTYLPRLASFIPWLILVPILSFFFLKDIHYFRESFLRCFPPGRWRARAESVLSDVNLTLAAYTRAQLISCCLIGLVCTVGFYVIGMKYALLLGILAGIFEFVPMIGPLTIAILATSVAGFSDSPLQALWTAAFLVALRLVHDYVTYPRIVREGVHLPPLAVILSILAGEQLAGIPGVFLSIPIAALLIVLYRHVLEHTGRDGLVTGWFEPQKAAEKSDADLVKAEET